MSDAPPPGSGLSRTAIVTSTVATPLALRPTHETLDGVAQWLRGPARREVSFAKVLDEYGWRLTAAGIGLLRVAFNTNTLHPQFIGATYHWWKDVGETRKIMIMHEVMDVVPYADNPIQQARLENKTIRRRRGGDPALWDFSVLADLHCHEDQPACSGCSLRSVCPTGQEAKAAVAGTSKKPR